MADFWTWTSYTNFFQFFFQNFLKKGQKRWKRAFWPKFFYWLVRTPENNCACQISAFFHFWLPQKRTFWSCDFTKIRKFRSKLGQKGVKIGEKVPFSPIFFIGWLESLKKVCMQNFSFLSLFVTPKTGIFILRFLRKLTFSIFWLFNFQKFTKSSFFKISSWNSRFE